MGLRYVVAEKPMKIKHKNIILLALFFVFLGGCGTPHTPSKSYEKGDKEVGYASWYGGKFHGRKTASGETYDQDKMTAAHKTAPFGTLVRVTNLDNGKNTIVKINDRGPFVKGRIIDLSREAARRIGMLTTGTARVKLDYLTRAAVNEGRFMIQTGSYRDQENAQMQKRDILAKFPTLKTQIVDNNGYFKVQVGPYPTHDKAHGDLRKIQKGNFDGIILQF